MKGDLAESRVHTSVGVPALPPLRPFWEEPRPPRLSDRQACVLRRPEAADSIALLRAELSGGLRPDPRVRVFSPASGAVVEAPMTNT